MGQLVVTDKEGNTVTTEAQEGASVMENIVDLDNSVDAVCGGACCCATCHCYIDSEWTGKIPPREYDEQWLLEKLDCFDEERSRLTCQIQYTSELDGMKLAVAPEE